MAEALQGIVGMILAANAALILAVGLLVLSTIGLRQIGLERDWSLRRRLTGLAWLLVLALPLALAAVPGNAWNATDVLVGHFLRGNLSNLSISATDFSAILALRDNLPRSIATPATLFWKLVAVTLLTAAILRAAYVIRSALRLRKTVLTARTLRQTATLRIAVSETCPVPFASRGILRHHVVLPVSLLLDREAFRIALAHELQHIRQGDPMRELFVAAASPIFVLNPTFWTLIRQTRRIREHDCDAACVSRPSISARDYSLCLLEVARRAGSRPTRAPGAFSVALLGRRQLTGRATQSQLGHRIEMIAAGPTKPANRLVTVALLVLFAASLSGTAWTLRPPADWSHERLMLSSVMNLERLETINTLSQRPLR